MVMKMFERMAKQEERKKEAQSRMEHTTKVKEPTIRTKEPSRKSRESRDSRSTSESMTADMKQLPTADTPSFMVKEQVTRRPNRCRPSCQGRQSGFKSKCVMGPGLKTGVSWVLVCKLGGVVGPGLKIVGVLGPKNSKGRGT